ncbi:phosphate acyltransferase PlsX [Halomonas shantousis]
MRIAIDAMGGDLGPRTAVAGTFHALDRHPDLEALLFGPRAVLEAEVDALPRRLLGLRSRLTILDAPHVISQEMRPSNALRGAEQSSLYLMLAAVRDACADACVSAGNTGAMMALARRMLGTVMGIDRPAISTAIPTQDGGRCYMLDLGANVDVQARHLQDFARLGAVMARVVDGLEKPRVALLNVGVEANKGAARVREADVLLRQTSGLNYVGFVEGDAIFSGEVDVVVCDGFVGNIVLKSSEGLARMLMKRLQETFEAHWTTRLVSFLARPALYRLKGQLDPVRYNGASLLGLSGIVVKSHGGADEQGFAWAISRAVREVQMALPRYLAQELGEDRSAQPSILSASASDEAGREDSGFSARLRSDESHPQR